MAIPIIPIIMAVAALGQGIVQGISNKKNAEAEVKALQESTQGQVNERARQAKKLMSQQKTSFLKSGVYFEGTPEEIINETYETYQKDLADMTKDANRKSTNLMRQGKTAFYSSILEGMANAGMAYFMGGGNGSALKSIGQKISNSNAGTAVQNWYNSARGWTKGGFGQLQKGNGLPVQNGTKIV